MRRFQLVFSASRCRNRSICATTRCVCSRHHGGALEGTTHFFRTKTEGSDGFPTSDLCFLSTGNPVLFAGGFSATKLHESIPKLERILDLK